MDDIDDALLDEERIDALVTVGAGALAGFLVRKGLEGGWRALRGTEPPGKPVDREVGWADALAWAAVSAAGVAIARVVTKRLASGARARLRKRLPG